MTTTTATREVEHRFRRLVTPTGRLISSAPPGTDAWHAARAAGITATDLPKILGLVDKYGTALTVWGIKTGRMADDEAGEAALWGNLLEDVVAREAARRLGLRIRRVGVIGHRDHPWRRVSLDRLVTGCIDGVRCGMEVKTRSAHVRDRWRAGVPDDTLAQVVWQLHVSGLDHMHVAVLIGGQTLELHVVHRDEVTDVERLAVDAAVDLWDHVQRDVQPHVDPTPGLIDSLNRLFTTRTGDLPMTPEHLELALDYRAAAGRATAADKDKRKAQAALMQALGGHERVVDSAGDRLYGMRPTVEVDADRALDEARDLWFEAAARGFVGASFANADLRDEDPELWQQLIDAGVTTTRSTFVPPTRIKETTP